MTTNQGNDMSSFNDEESVEDEALTDRDEEVEVSSIDLHNMLNCELCESKSKRSLLTISKRMENDEEALVACGNIATVDNRHHCLFELNAVREVTFRD